jgi:hypothetical protein
VQALELDHLLACFGIEQVQRLAPDDAGHGTVAALELDPLADQDLGVPASYRSEPEETLLVDVADHKPDLIDVADDRKQWRGLADAGHRGADSVAGERRERGGLTPDPSGLGLVARRPECA